MGFESETVMLSEGFKTRLRVDSFYKYCKRGFSVACLQVQYHKRS